MARVKVGKDQGDVTVVEVESHEVFSANACSPKWSDNGAFGGRLAHV